MTTKAKIKNRGFGSMSPEQRREIASKGGKAAQALGTAHRFTSAEASAAGRVGGSRSRRRPKREPVEGEMREEEEGDETTDE